MSTPGIALLGLLWQIAALASPGGRVVDGRTRAPVADAEIMVLGSAGASRTDADGYFVWTAAPTTPTVIVVMLRDGRVARPVRIASVPTGSPLTIAIEPALQETMTVTGVSSEIDTSRGTAVLRLGPADLALRQPATLVQALEAVPGVHAIAEGQGAVPVIRGLGRGRTLILVDGARATSERRAGPNAAFVDPGTVQSVEVARGPGSVAYGSDALGGVIALRLAGPDPGAGWRGRFSGTLGAGVPEQRGGAEVSRGYGSGGILLGVRARDFADYDSPFGTVAGSAWRDRGARLAWEQDLGQSRLSLRWESDFGRDLGRPRSDSNVVRVTSPVDDSHRLTLSWERPTAGAFRHLRVDALVAAALQRTDQDRLPTSARPRSLESSETSYRDLQLRLVAERALGRGRLQTGVDLQGRYGLRTRDSVSSYDLDGARTQTATTLSIDQADRTGAGVFVDATLPIVPRLQASFGGRLDSVHNRNRGGFWGDRSVSNTALAGVLALTAAPVDALSVTAQVARGFRDPTLTDRFYRGPVGRGVVEGNPDLSPETSLQLDLTVRATAGRLLAEVSAYRYSVAQLIEQYAVSQTLFRFRNRGEASFRGVELTASVAASRGFALEIAAQAARGTDGVDATPLNDVAPESLSLILRHALAERLNSYVRLAAYRAHDAAGPSEVPTPGYRLLDAGVSWRIASRIMVHGILRNALDEPYYASSGPRWVHAPGRQAALTMEIRF